MQAGAGAADGDAGVKNLVAVAKRQGRRGEDYRGGESGAALKNLGATVGLMDADVYGRSPADAGDDRAPQALDEKNIIPVQAYGLKIISMGLLNPGDKPLVWRVPCCTA